MNKEEKRSNRTLMIDDLFISNKFTVKEAIVFTSFLNFTSTKCKITAYAGNKNKYYHTVIKPNYYIERYKFNYNTVNGAFNKAEELGYIKVFDGKKYKEVDGVRVQAGTQRFVLVDFDKINNDFNTDFEVSPTLLQALNIWVPNKTKQERVEWIEKTIKNKEEMTIQQINEEMKNAEVKSAAIKDIENNRMEELIENDIDIPTPSEKIFIAARAIIPNVNRSENKAQNEDLTPKTNTSIKQEKKVPVIALKEPKSVYELLIEYLTPNTEEKTIKGYLHYDRMKKFKEKNNPSVEVFDMLLDMNDTARQLCISEKYTVTDMTEEDIKQYNEEMFNAYQRRLIWRAENAA